MHNKAVSERIGERKIVLWGAGNDAYLLTGEMGKTGIPISFFVSSSAQKGETFLGFPVCRPDVLDKREHFVIIASSFHQDAISDALRALDFAVVEDFSCWNEVRLHLSFPDIRPVPLATIQGQYDHVFSMGSSCQVAYNMMFNGLRNIAGPFDWMITADSARMAQGIHNRFEGLFRPGNLRRIEDPAHDEPMALFMDDHDDMLVVHDIRLKDYQANRQQSIDAFYSKFRRRMDRMYEIIASGGHTMLLRMLSNKDYTPSMWYLFAQEIRRQWGNDCSSVQIAPFPSHKPILYEISPNAYVAFMRAKNGTERKAEHRHWTGHIADMHQLLRGISLKGQPSSHNRLEIERILADANGRQTIVCNDNDFIHIEALLMANDQTNFMVYYDDKRMAERIPSPRRIASLTDAAPEQFLIFPESGDTDAVHAQMANLGRVPGKDYALYNIQLPKIGAYDT